MSLTDKRDYTEALAITQCLIERLRPACERIEMAGSLRRKRPVITPEEIDVFRPVGLDWIPPAERELGRWGKR